MRTYTDLTREDARKWLGRYGTSGTVQQQVMSQLSEGQKAKVVFCKMAKEQAHLLLLDEPTNALDMEMIDSLADAINHFSGGVVLVSHDMRLISQVANEIWMVDKGVSKYQGDILNFKMDLRRQMKLEDASKTAGPKKHGDPPPQTQAPAQTPQAPPSFRLDQQPPPKLDEHAPPPPPQPAAPRSRADMLRDATAPPPSRYVPPARREAAAANPQPGDGAW